MTTAQEPTWRPKVDPAVVGVIAVLATLLSGRYVTAPNLAWYATLAKPSFNPPDWVFAPVWGLLYLLMAVAIWRVMQKPPSAARTLAAVLFFIQLALNAAWSWAFFAAHGPLLGLIDIVPQELAVIGAIVVFRRLDAIAAWCLVPLAAWVGFAMALNAAVWSLN